MNAEPEAATVIISVYRDAAALRVILEALAHQTCPGFEVLVSEDGEDPAIAAVVQEACHRFSQLVHLTQPDIGFRKNRALNRAILAAHGGCMIFIDGDCVPHPRFVESHLAYSKPGVVCSGRRIELGEKYSARMRAQPAIINELASPIRYLLLAGQLRRDRIKNYELGFRSTLLQCLLGGRSTGLVGCNFSCQREDLFKINGFDEAYAAPGIGEDTDIEWRLRRIGVQVRNIKYVALQYHLHHPRGYQVPERNYHLLQEARTADRWYCTGGLESHRSAGV